jgi:NADPH-dependent 2,4-dienoyl-CoA reductase/sulfur reductase-like enzyme
LAATGTSGSDLDTVVVVGTGAAGFAVAEQLRRDGYTGELTLYGSESGLPYDRPPLSKQVLAGDWEPERATLLDRARIDALGVRIVEDTVVTGLDTEAHTIATGEGDEHSFDAAVVATGVTPRELPHEDLANVNVLRTMGDALRLRELLAPGHRLVIVGAGFLGLETAATARSLGCEVTVVEPLPEPLANRIGATAAALLLAMHRQQGVRVITGTGVVSLHGHAGEPESPFIGSSGEPGHAVPVREVELTDGTTLEADSVLVAIGCEPRLDGLTDGGLFADDGVVCDELCRAAPGVWAAGDVARWFHTGLDRHVRLEHRTNATQQGQAVARNILGADEPFVPVPYFWTDHFGKRIQLTGVLPEDVEEELAEGSPEDGSFVLTFRSGGAVVGALGWNAARQFTGYRRELEIRPREES